MSRGIQTFYNGLTFRSMLEARWFAFFELLGVVALYEPFELTGYIPDFTLQETDLLVEAKPISNYRADCADHFQKIVRSGWTKNSLVVGGLWTLGKREGYHVVGLIALPAEKVIVPLVWGIVNGTLVWFVHDNPSFDHLSGKTLTAVPAPLTSRQFSEVEVKWGIAHSRTRWRP